MKGYEFKHAMAMSSQVFGRDNVKVVFEGTQAKTDGKVITLPNFRDDIEFSPSEVRTLRAYVDHEAGHIRNSDMKVLLDKYDLWNRTGKSSLCDMHNIIEDVWMENKVVSDYPGAAKNLAELNGIQCGTFADELEAANLTDIPPSMTAVRDYILAGHTNNNNPNAADDIKARYSDRVKEFGDRFTHLAKECKNTAEAIRLARAIYRLLKEDDPNLDKTKAEDFDPSSGDDFDDSQPGDEPAKGKDKKGKGKEGEGEATAKSIVEGIVGENGLPSGISGKPQGDGVGDYTILTTEFDVIHTKDNEDTLKKGNLEQFRHLKSSMSSVIPVLRSKLKRALLAKERRDWDVSKEDGKLDSKRLVAAVGGSKNVYKTRKDREETNTAVCLVVDMSGSMSGGKIKLATQTAIALSEALSGTNVAIEIFGFDNPCLPKYVSSEGYKFIHRADVFRVRKFKEYDEPLKAARKTLGTMTSFSMQNNSDRDAIVFATASLLKRQEKKKIMIVLSDGCPANQCHNVSYRELTRHAKLAALEAERQGIHTLGIGICDSTVKEIYRNCVVISRAEDLSKVAIKEMAKLLLDAPKKTKRAL